MMKRTLAVMVAVLLSSGIAAAVRKVQPKAADVAAHENASSEKLIVGCITETQGTFTLLDPASGEKFVLDGNGWMLKQQIGHSVALTGNQVGLVPGSNLPAFQVEDMEELSDRCAAKELQQRTRELEASLNALGRVSNTSTGGEPHIGYSAGLIEAPAPMVARNHMHGQPPNWEMVGQSEAAAQRFANAARWSELSPSGF